MAKLKPLGMMSNKAAWKSKMSAAHRGPRPGKQTVQKAPARPSQKVRW